MCIYLQFEAPWRRFDFLHGEFFEFTYASKVKRYLCSIFREPNNFHQILARQHESLLRSNRFWLCSFPRRTDKKDYTKVKDMSMTHVVSCVVDVSLESAKKKWNLLL